MTRLVVANLDAEAEFGGRVLSSRAREAAGVFGALMASFCEEGDALWLPVEGASELPEIHTRDGECPTVVCGGLANIAARYDELVAWCETPRVSAARTTPGSVSPDTVAALHNRRFAHEVARDVGLVLPGTRWVTSRGDLMAAAREEGSASPTHAGWIAKAPMSAAGRERWSGRLDAGGLTAATRLVETHGAALLEPRCERIDDFGWVGWIDDAGSSTVGVHRLLVDIRGRFGGIEIPDGLPLDLAGQLESVGLDVGARLHARGLRGGYGIDAWRWRGPDGRVAFHPLGEINARMTMAHVARQWQRRASVSGVRLSASNTPPSAPSSALLAAVSSPRLSAQVVAR